MWPVGNVYGHGKLLMVIYATIKKYQRLSKEVCVSAKTTVQMFREREEAGRQILVYEAQRSGLRVQEHQQ